MSLYKPNPLVQMDNSQLKRQNQQMLLCYYANTMS